MAVNAFVIHTFVIQHATLPISIIGSNLRNRRNLALTKNPVCAKSQVPAQKSVSSMKIRIDERTAREDTAFKRSTGIMANHVGTCPNCKATVHADIAPLLIKTSRLSCWWCGYAEDAIAFELRQPGLSPNDRALLSVVFLGV